MGTTLAGDLRDLVKQEGESQPNTPYRRRLELEKTALAVNTCCDHGGRTFLPGYGFPTDIYALLITSPWKIISRKRTRP